jgi:EpsI family protein
MEPGSLASRLYGSTLARAYRQTSTGSGLTLLIAHGETQSDDLMLHRPEICYPAFGFAIASSQPVAVTMGGGVTLPARTIVAKVSDRTENVLYWTRLGEFFPQDRKEQQVDRLRTALKGEIGDGVLFRMSQDTQNSTLSFAFMRGFAAELIRAMARKDRSVFIGTGRANAMGAV